MGRRALLFLSAVLAGALLAARHGSAKLTAAPPPAPAATDAPLLGFEQDQLTAEAVGRVPREHAHLFAFDTTGPVLRSGECKSFPGDADWPSEGEWDALDEVLGGALIKSVPLAAPCHRGWSVQDAARCEALVGRWTSPYTHIEDPTSVMWPIWEGLTCVPTEWGGGPGCSLGGYPVYVVNATSVAQVQAAVNFARNKGLRLVIKNTGHDYMGRSTGAGALSIWTHHLTQMEYHSQYTAGTFTGKAVHVGSGARTLEVAQVARENGATLVGGQCASVGFAGGYFAGGGLSPLSSLLGMAADHVLAVNIVTADGRFRSVTAESHPDLFWAIRGGGASTWGVVTSVIVRLHPSIPLTTSLISFQTSAEVSVETFWKGVRAYAEHFERFGDAGFYGYFTIRRNSALYGGSEYSLGIEPMMAPNASLEAFDKLARPLFDELTELGIPFRAEQRHFDTFFQGWVETWPDTELVVSSPLEVQGSRLFPREMWREPEGLTAILDAIRRVSGLGHDVTGFLISPGNPSGADNAVSPAVRHALGYLSSAVGVAHDPTPGQLAAAQAALMGDIMGPWREVAPSSVFGGSYLNEANPMEPLWQDDFYGSGYARLLEVKRRWDAGGLFYATTAVGSEGWEVRSPAEGIQTQNGRLCRVDEGAGDLR